MERRGKDKDMGIPMGYSSTTTITTVADRRRNDQTGRGSTVLLNHPTQTLDHHHHFHQQLNLQPQQQQQQQQTHVVGRDPTPDPDPDPAPAPTIVSASSNSKTPPPPPPPPPAPPSLATNSGGGASLRYRECLKNHAANMGSHVVDGCGEFMPSGEEGSPEALKCAACDCHRNFHRKEVEGESQPGANSYYPYNNPNSNSGHRTTTTRLPHPVPPPLPPPPPPPPMPHRYSHGYSHHGIPTTQPMGSIPPVMMAFGGVPAESSSEDLNIVFHSNDGTQPPMAMAMAMAQQPPFSVSKKRFRTKFSQEQKDRMQEMAERLGWKIQKQDEQQVHQFCAEVGVKRQVFKVWMHNNKQAAMKKKPL